MAVDRLSGNGDSPFSAAPAGLQQQRQAEAPARDTSGQGVNRLSGGDAPWLKPAWNTGGQVGTTRNAFNDDFFNRMYGQYDEERKKTEQDPKYVSNLFLRDDFTGIVGWDQQFNASNPTFTLTDSQRARTNDGTFKTGDIYDNGRYLGNVYDKTSGFTLEEANAYVAPHIFGDKAADKYKEANGDQERLKSFILDEGKKQGQQVSAYQTRIPYENDVNSLLAEWDQGAWDELAIAGAGALGGAAAGAVAGPWGILAGAVLGAAGSLLNKDEAARQAAQTIVSTNIVAQQKGDGIAASHAVQQWAGLGLTRLNVFSNLLNGSVDTFSGNWGDNKSEAQRAADDGNVGLQVGQAVTGFADALLTGSNKIAATAYMGLAETSAVAGAVTKATGDGQWDEISGTFHQYETIDERLAAYGASAIDVSQGMLPGLLRRSSMLGVGGTKANTLEDLAEVGSKGRVTIMDRTFNVENQAGKLVATSEDKAASFLGWLAPSTITSRLSVRAAAQSEALRKGATSVSADDLYQAAVRIERASVPWKLALVNGFGEAAEEVLQTYLDGHAVGWAPEPQEALQAGIAGFVMGAGMSVGSRIGTIAQDQRMLYRANVLNIMDGERPYDKAEWKALSVEDKTRLSTPKRGIERTIRAQREAIVDSYEDVLVNSTQALSAVEDATRLYTKTAKVKLNGPALEDMGDILPFENVNIPSHHVLHSATTTLQRFESRFAAIQQRIQDNAEDGNVIATLQQTEGSLRQLLETVLRPGLDMYDQTGDEGILTQINLELQRWWDGDPEQKSAVELVFSRMPNDNPGSFQMLLPQIDIDMTRVGAHDMTKISQSLEKFLSHDNDGDRIKHQARFVPDPVSRRNMRLGIHHWTDAEGVPVSSVEQATGASGNLQMTKRTYELNSLRNMGLILAGNDYNARADVHRTFEFLVQRMRDGLGNVVPEQVYRDFRANLTRNPEGAKSDFYKAISPYKGELVLRFERGTMGDRRVPEEAQVPSETAVSLWMENQFQVILEQYRNDNAARAYTETVKPSARAAQPPLNAPDLESTRETRAATPGQTNEQRSGGSDAFRSVGGLQYGPINSEDLDSEGHRDPSALRQQLIEWYTVLTRGRSGTQIESIRQGGNPVVREARADLETIAKLYYPTEMQGGAETREALLFRIANTPFWNFSMEQLTSDGWNMEKHNKFNATLAQVLLNRAAERVDMSTPPVFGELEVAISYKNINKGRANALLLGYVSPSNMLSAEEAASLGSFSTLDSSVKHYTQLVDRSDREAWRNKQKQVPSYNEPDSLFRLYVDTVREAVDSELAHSSDGTGHATGRYATEDRAFHKKTVLPIFDGVRRIVDQLGLRDATPARLIEQLEADTRLVRVLLDSLPQEMRIRMVGRVDNAPANTVTLPGWFFDILTSESSEKSAMIYFRETLLTELMISDGESAPSNTWVALYKSLEAGAQQTFRDMLTNATDVQSFVDTVNLHFAFQRPPMLAWRTDMSMFDPASTHAGWQWAAPSAERRTALRNAYTYVTTRAEALNGDRSLTLDSVNYAQHMLDAARNPLEKNSYKYKAALNALKNRLAQAQRFYHPAMGPAGIREFVFRAYRGIDPASAAKGIASPAVAQFADTDVRRDQTSFGHQLDQVMNALGAVDAKDLAFNTQMLNKPQRIETETGAIINWETLNEVQFLEAFTADNGAYASLLFDLLNPTVYEENATGHTTQQHLLPKSLEAVLSETTYSDMLLGTGSRSERENDELFISFVNSKTPNNAVVRLMGMVAAARTTGKGATQQMTNSQYVRLVGDVAKALRSAVGLSGTAEDARAQMRVESVISYFQDTELEAEGAALRVNKIKELVKARQAVVDDLRQKYETLQDPQSLLDYVEAMQKHSQAVALLDVDSVGQIMLRAFKIDWNSPSEIITRTAIQQYIRLFGPSMQTTLTGEDQDLLDKYNIANNAHDGLVTFNRDMAKNKADWDHLSRIVALHNAMRTGGYRAASFIATPQAKEFELFDPTYSYLGENVLSDEIWNALQEFKAAAGSVPVETKTYLQFRRDLEQTVLDRRLLGVWTPDLVAQHSGANRYLDSSGSGTQVAIGGDALKNRIAHAISSTRTFAVPSNNMARAISLPVNVLLDSSNNFYDKGFNGEPWAVLENAAVLAGDLAPALVVRDAAGAETSRVPLLQALRPIQVPEGNGAGQISQITHAGLVAAAKREFDKLEGSTDNVTVEFSMFHPADKPATPEFANNIYFDGTLGDLDVSRSLIDALIAGTDGFVQRLQRAALDSIKGSLAIFTKEHPRWDAEKNPERLGDLIHDMAREVMMTQMGKEYFFPENTYRGVYKLIRDSLVVMNDQGEVFSSEQVLSSELPPGNYRVVELSRRTLETLRGSTSGSGHARILTRAPRIGGEAEPWTGTYSPEQLARVPELGRIINNPVEAAAALRASGMLTSDRVTTYRYKDWTADSKAMNFRPFQEFDAARQDIKDARRRPENLKMHREINESLMERLALQYESMHIVDSMTREQLIGNLGAAPIPVRDKQASQTRTLSDLLGMLNGTAGRVWEVDARNVGYSAEGKIATVRSVVGPTHNQIAPVDDMVVLNLDGFEGSYSSTQWRNAVRDELAAMRERGLIITLTSNDSAKVREAEETLLADRTTYTRINQQLPIFAPKNADEMQQTLYARHASLVESEVTDIRRMTVSFLDLKGDFAVDAEGSLLDERSRWHGQGMALGSNIVPTNLMSQFSSPRTPEAGARVQSILEALNTPEGYTYLAEQALHGDGKAITEDALAQAASEIAPLVRKAVETLDPSTGLPRRGAMFELGDITVQLKMGTGQPLISRWGYDTEGVDFDAQRSNGFDGVNRGGIASSSAVLYVGTKRVSSDKASVRGGEIDQWFDDPTFGTRASFITPITYYGAKNISNGLKTRGVYMNESQRPSVPLLNDLLPAQYIQKVGTDKKAATQGIVANAREAINLFGWDATPALANALGFLDGHPTKNAARWSTEDWASVNESVRQSIQGQVREFLNIIRNTSKNRISDPLELANAILTDRQYTEVATMLRKEASGTSFAAAQAAANAVRVDSDAFSAETAYLYAVYTYLRGDGTYVSQVMGAPGVNQPGDVEAPNSHKMPAALTEFIDMNPELRAYVQADMNSRMSHNQYAESGDLLEGWWINDNWSVFNKNPDGRGVTGFLQVTNTLTSGEDHSEQTQGSNAQSTSDSASNQQQMVAESGLNLDLGYGIRDKNLDRILSAEGYSRFERRRDVDSKANQLVEMSLDEQQYRKDAAYKASGFLQPLDRTEWDNDRRVLEKVNNGYRLIANTLGLNSDGRYQSLIDSMVRTFFRASHDPKNPDVDKLSAADVLEATTSILDSLSNGRWPTMEGFIPIIHADLVDVIAREGSWTPDGVIIDGDRQVALLENALDVLMHSKTQLPADAMLEVDSLFLSYEKFLTDGYWSPSAYPQTIVQLLNKDGDRFVSTLDPYSQMRLERGNPYKEFDTTAGDDLSAIQTSGGSNRTQLPSRTEAARRRRRIFENGKGRGGAEPQTMAALAVYGRKMRDEVVATNAFWRNAHAIRTIVPQLNPLLWIWNPVDTAFRRLPGAAGGLATGSSTGFVGQMIRQRVNELNAISKKAAGSSDVAAAFREAFGITETYINEDNIGLLREVVRRLERDQDFRSTIAGETRHRPDEMMTSRGDRIRQKAVDTASMLQDVTHGMIRRHEAQMYVEQVLEYERVNNPAVTAFDVLARLRDNPLSYLREGPVGAHTQAVRNIQNIKGAKQTTVGAMIDRVLIPMAHSHNGIAYNAANTLLLLAKFRNFAISSMVNMAGLQGLDAAGSILLQTAAFKRNNFRKPEDQKTPTDYIGQVLESSDIADLFIRSGLSHTGLFMAAMAFNTLGLTGDDEEERQRKRIAALQGLGTLYDPRDIANDFRNRNAIWLEGLSGSPLGFLSAMYATPTAEGQPQRSPAQLHWTLNFFVAPTMGITEFLQSGDWSDVVRGFESAVGNMPLINTNFFWDAVNTSNKMYSSATDDVVDDPGSLTDGVSLLVKAVGTLEKSLFEFAFINEIVAASDQYARNPWGKVETDEQGNIVFNRAGVPDLTDATETQIDDNPDSPTYGQVVDRRQTLSYSEGLIRNFTQNNQTAAFLATLVTGFRFGKEGSFMRGDMAASQTTLQKSSIETSDAEQIFLSIWDDDNSREVLTRDGMERIVDSLHAGTIKATDPAFQNIFITGEQRAEISDSLQKKIFVEGVTTLGLTEEEATERMEQIWNGYPGLPQVPSLSDVVWSRGDFAGENGIPWKQTTTYRQLNTTWAQGPDGKYWATGVSRDSIMGLPLPLNSYRGAAGFGMQSNLGVDEILNSTDEVNQINTGYRALTRADESEEIPGDEELLAQIKKSTERVMDEIQNLGSDLYKNMREYGGGYRYGSGGRGYGGGGGGGYGGGGSNPYMPFVNGMRMPYADNIPQIYINNVNVRRASLRRERFSSERGRLNQWQ